MGKSTGGRFHKNAPGTAKAKKTKRKAAKTAKKIGRKAAAKNKKYFT